MKRELVIKGKTADEKFASVENVLRRMGRRLSTKVIGVLPVSPIYDFIYEPETDGVVMRKLVPAPGIITKLCFYAASKGDKAIGVHVELANSLNNTMSRVDYAVKRNTIALVPNLKVDTGDRITISVTADNAEELEKLRGIWVALLYEIDYNSLKQTEFLLEQFEAATAAEVLEDASESQEN